MTSDIILGMFLSSNLKSPRRGLQQDNLKRVQNNMEEKKWNFLVGGGGGFSYLPAKTADVHCIW